MKKANILLVLAAISVLGVGFVKFQSGAVVGTNIGNKAPELKFKNPQDKEISLSSLNLSLTTEPKA